MNRLTEPRTETTAARYPAQIEDAQLAILGYNDQIRRVSEKIQVLEDGFTLAILRVLDVNGKAYFSNETSRAIELRNRLSNSEEYLSLKLGLQGYEDMKSVAVAKLERLRGEFKLQLVEKWQEFGRLLQVEPMSVGIPVMP